MNERPWIEYDQQEGTWGEDWQEDIPESEWLAAASTNPVFRFLGCPDEAVYTLDEGGCD